MREETLGIHQSITLRIHANWKSKENLRWWAFLEEPAQDRKKRTAAKVRNIVKLNMVGFEKLLYLHSEKNCSSPLFVIRDQSKQFPAFSNVEDGVSIHNQDGRRVERPRTLRMIIVMTRKFLVFLS